MKEPKYFGITTYGACWWIHLWKYVVRIGNPFAGFKYAWRPLFSAFRCWK